MLGGGVGDSYQPVEQQYQLGRKTLELLHERNFPVHILTKSTLVKRDIDILKKINDQSRAIVSMSFSTVDDHISALFEPGVPPPSQRLEILRFFKKEGIPIGIFLLPVIPYITDTPEMIEETVRSAHDIGVDFIIFGGMTLKEGKQKNLFYESLGKKYPELIAAYHQIYKKDFWGQASSEYYASIQKTFNVIAKTYKIPKRIPPKLYSDILDENDRVVVILEHIDYLLKSEGKPSNFGYAAFSISAIKEPLSSMKQEIHHIKGVGPIIEKTIREILETKTSSFYEKLLIG